jgi:DNA-binding IclR family transcriptional regulator
MTQGRAAALGATSVEKALEICEALGAAPAGMSLTELARQLKQPRPSVHRLLALLKRRGYARQDEETQRYSLTLKMLDLCFRQLGQSEIRLHAYTVLREYVLRSGLRTFLTVPSFGEVTYIWSTGPDQIAMRTVFGRDMPAHCSVYFDRTASTLRRLSCLRLAQATDVQQGEQVLSRFGPPGSSDSLQRLICTCAPVMDYRAREVAKVGIFRHAPDDGPLTTEHSRDARELARRISKRLGHLPAASLTGAA